jgi:general secretion pathway protein B
MSILLEALKKSERQRQLGQTPTLETPADTPPPSPVSLNHWIPISLAALSAMVMMWFGMQQFRAPDPVEVPAAKIESADIQGQPEARTMTENFKPVESEPDGRISPGLVAVSKNNDRARARLQQSFNDFKQDQEETKAQPQQEAAAEEVAVTQPESRSVAQKSPRQSVPPETEPSRSPPSRADAGRNDPGRAGSEPGLEPHISEPISYWELPQGIRDSLGEIRITVLVYAEKPDDRFLLTNGQRMVEKNQMPNGLVLDEIRRDGAVFRYRNYRFLVKG